jgi:hypothetical protein
MGSLAPGSAHARPSAQAPISGDCKQFSFFKEKTPKKSTPRGQRGSLEFCSTPNLIFSEPYHNRFWEKSNPAERRERREKRKKRRTLSSVIANAKPLRPIQDYLGGSSVQKSTCSHQLGSSLHLIPRECFCMLYAQRRNLFRMRAVLCSYLRLIHVKLQYK